MHEMAEPERPYSRRRSFLVALKRRGTIKNTIVYENVPFVFALLAFRFVTMQRI